VRGHPGPDGQLGRSTRKPAADLFQPAFPRGDDQVAVSQVGQGDALSRCLGQGVACRDQGRPGLFVNRHGVQALGVVGLHDEAHLGQTVGNAVEDFVRTAGPDGIGHLRMVGPESGDPLGQEPGRVAFHCGDVHSALQALTHFRQVFLGPLGQVFYGQGILEKGLTLGRQVQALVAALKKRGAQFLLQGSDLPAQGRLGDHELLGGLCDAQGVGDGNEIMDMAHFHGHPSNKKTESPA
jgi:hypothetical protein